MLWVDDDISISRMAERVLPLSGIEVEVANTAKEAARVIDRGIHDAVVLDQRLPGSADLEVLRRLRRKGDRTPVIVLTGYGDPAAAVVALKLGVIDYLVKPARIERILAAIRIAMRCGRCEPLNDTATIALRPDVSLALVAVFFNAIGADGPQLQTQLAWAIADDALSFPERVAAVEALGKLLTPASDGEIRRQVETWLRKGLSRPFAEQSDLVRAFVQLMKAVRAFAVALLASLWMVATPSPVGASQEDGCYPAPWYQQCSVDGCVLNGETGVPSQQACVNLMQAECDNFCGTSWNYWGVISGVEWDEGDGDCGGSCSCECEEQFECDVPWHCF